MAEEIRNAAVVLPRAIMLSVLINGILGFSMLIAVLFCMEDVEKALKSPTGYPFIEIFFQATKSVTGAVLMTTIILIITMFGVMGILAALSRQFWSFARDRAIPGWRLWVKVSKLPQLSFTVANILGIAIHGNACIFHSSPNIDCLAFMPH